MCTTLWHIRGTFCPLLSLFSALLPTARTHTNAHSTITIVSSTTTVCAILLTVTHNFSLQHRNTFLCTVYQLKNPRGDSPECPDLSFALLYQNALLLLRFNEMLRPSARDYFLIAPINSYSAPHAANSTKIIHHI